MFYFVVCVQFVFVFYVLIPYCYIKRPPQLSNADTNRRRESATRPWRPTGSSSRTLETRLRVCRWRWSSWPSTGKSAPPSGGVCDLCDVTKTLFPELRVVKQTKKCQRKSQGGIFLISGEFVLSLNLTLEFWSFVSFVLWINPQKIFSFSLKLPRLWGLILLFIHFFIVLSPWTLLVRAAVVFQGQSGEGAEEGAGATQRRCSQTGQRGEASWERVSGKERLTHPDTGVSSSCFQLQPLFCSDTSSAFPPPATRASQSRLRSRGWTSTYWWEPRTKPVWAPACKKSDEMRHCRKLCIFFPLHLY